MSFDRAAAIGHFANTSGGTIRLGDNPTLTQGDSYFAAIINSAGTVIDNPGGQRTWGGSLRSGRRLWGPAGSEALDQSVTRPDATAKTFSLNLDNVAPAGDTLIVSVSGVGPFNETLENLPGANFVIQIKTGLRQNDADRRQPAWRPTADPTDSATIGRARKRTRFVRRTGRSDCAVW